MKATHALVLAVVALGCPADMRAPVAAPEPPPPATAEFARDVRPVLERRCAVCHGCYDAPCQLDLTAYEGVARGATKPPVYDSTRLREAPLTRLFEDARSAQAWREKGFFPVLGSKPDEALLLRMLALGEAAPFPADAPLPDNFPLDITRALTCPTSAEFDAYAEAHPLGGMPYGTARLARAERDVIERWVRAGAPPSPEPALAATTQARSTPGRAS